MHLLEYISFVASAISIVYDSRGLLKLSPIPSIKYIHKSQANFLFAEADHDKLFYFVISFIHYNLLYKIVGETDFNLDYFILESGEY